MTKPYRPSLLKRLTATTWFRATLTFLASFYLRALFNASYLTGRVEWRIHPDAAPYISGEKQSIYCFWHGRLLFMAYFANSRKRRMNVLASHHRDGRLIADTVRWLGVRAIYGSSSRGALGALREILKKTKVGENLAISPDGPRGPYQIAASGVVWIAARTKLPIIPMTYSATPRRHMKSWDRFIVPHFFSRIVMQADAPLFIPADTDEDGIEQHRLQVEAYMQRQSAQLDAELS